MEYEITIQKREPNPKYSVKRSPYEGTEELPYIFNQVLMTVLTEAEFKKIRDAVLKEF